MDHIIIVLVLFCVKSFVFYLLSWGWVLRRFIQALSSTLLKKQRIYWLPEQLLAAQEGLYPVPLFIRLTSFNDHIRKAKIFSVAGSRSIHLYRSITSNPRPCIITFCGQCITNWPFNWLRLQVLMATALMCSVWTSIPIPVQYRVRFVNLTPWADLQFAG